ncbi:MAG: hypothetical protein AAFX79_07595 [Planctomycetota bacterium]
MTDSRAAPSAQDLYELCVQSPPEVVRLLRAIHGGEPKILGEDFAGSGAISRAWVTQSETHIATAVDRDAGALARCDGVPRLTPIAGDALDADAQADAIWVGNFSIGYHHDRAQLVRYLANARARLHKGGVFVCDTYGGETAFLTGEVHRFHPLPEHLSPDGTGGWRIRYTWEQREADPLTGMVTDVLHFRLERAGVIDMEFPDAFVYRWRLWSVPELRDAMREAGLTRTAVYAQLPDAEDDDGTPYIRPIEDASELDDSFIVCVAGRVP